MSELPKSDKPINPIHTTDELAKLAGVGHTAYHQAKTILDSDNEDIKQKVLSGDMSINAGYNVIKPNWILLKYGCLFWTPIFTRQNGGYKMKKSNKTYVYNPEQAKFYIANGATVLDTGIHYKTHKVFWVFDFNATTEIFHKWCVQKREYML